MYQWDRAVFLPCFQFVHRIDEDDEVLILAFVKHLKAYQLSQSLRRCGVLRKLTLTWGAFPLGILLAVDRGLCDDGSYNVRSDDSLSSRELRQGCRGGGVICFNTRDLSAC
jgi:hypothetical protein